MRPDVPLELRATWPGTGRIPFGEYVAARRCVAHVLQVSLRVFLVCVWS